MKKLVTLSALIGLLLSCNQKTKEQLKIEEAMVIYNQNAEVIHALFDAIENEDLETAASFFAEEIKFNPPAYGGNVLDK